MILFFVRSINWNKFDILKIIQQPQDKRVTPPILLQVSAKCFLTFQMPCNETGSFVVKLNIDFAHRCHVMQSERYDFFKAVAFTLKITLIGLTNVA